VQLLRLSGHVQSEMAALATLATSKTSVECFCRDKHVKAHLFSRCGKSTKMAGVLAGDRCCTNANVVRPDVHLLDCRQERSWSEGLALDTKLFSHFRIVTGVVTAER